MAITYQRFFAPQQLGVSEAEIYAVPSTPGQTVMKSLRVRLANSTTNAATATLYTVPAAGAADATNVCLPGVSVDGNDYLDVDVPDMAAGDALWGKAGTASAITITQLDGFLKS
jgi:hypothetical protein